MATVRGTGPCPAVHPMDVGRWAHGATARCGRRSCRLQANGGCRHCAAHRDRCGDDDEPVLISIPNALGALVLKGAAYREDSRDRDRHLDDAVVLCATIRTPLGTAAQMKGSDRSRVLSLHKELADPGHRSWQLLDPVDRTPAMDALRILAANHSLPPANRLKSG